MGTLLLASEMPVPIPRNRTVFVIESRVRTASYSSASASSYERCSAAVDRDGTGLGSHRSVVGFVMRVLPLVEI